MTSATTHDDNKHPQARHSHALQVTWEQRTFLLPLFCLASLLGGSESLACALGLAATMTLILLLGTVLLQGLRWGADSTLGSLLICATLLVMVELGLHAWLPALYRRLDLYLPLCMIAVLLLARSELKAQISLLTALAQALRLAAGFWLAAIVMGAGRELVGHGSLFYDAAALYGSWAQPLSVQVFDAQMGFLLGILAPGAFVALGVGVALYNGLRLQWRRWRQ